MRIIKGLSKLGALLAILGGFVAAFAGAASASTEMVPRPAPDGGVFYAGRSPAPVVRTVVMGGMPGWQIALIAIVAALVAAAAAVLVDRARSARSRLASTPA